MEKSHKNLNAWQEAMDLVTSVYNVTGKFPDQEKYGLTSQMRRAAVSIPANIAEGAGRNSDKELIQFLYISLGSLEELETMIIIGSNLKYFESKKINEVEEKIVHIRKLLIGLIKYLKNKNKV